MEQLADNSNGSYAYVDDLDEAQKLFVEDLTSTLQVIALDAKIQVDFNPDEVAYYRLSGYENRDVCRRLWLPHSLDFRNNAVDAGEIGAAGNGADTQRHRPVRGHLPPQCRRAHRHRLAALGRPRYPSGDRDRAVTGVW
jgi:hypothetical protein